MSSAPTKKELLFECTLCNQNGRVWAGERKADVERGKFALHVIVSAAVCVGGKEHLYF